MLFSDRVERVCVGSHRRHLLRVAPQREGRPFYKVPVHRDFSSPYPVYTGKSQPSYKQEPSYKSDVSSYSSEPSYYKPQPSFYKPEPSYFKPQPSFYKPEPSYYKPEPSYYKSEPSYYKSEPSYKSDYGHGATSYQTVRLGGGDDYKPYY